MCVIVFYAAPAEITAGLTVAVTVAHGGQPFPWCGGKDAIVAASDSGLIPITRNGRIGTMRGAAVLLFAVLAASCSTFCVPGVSAQDPDLRPVADHLAEIEQDSLGVMRYVAMRCGSLYTLVSGQVEDQAPELSETYFSLGMLFMDMAQRAEQVLGATEAEAARFVGDTMTDIAALYRERMRKNMAARGSYFMDEPLIAEDLQTCRALSEVLWSGGG